MERSITPLVSAVILNYRTGRQAVTCTEELLKQTIADQMEIIVVDNHSEDDSIGLITAHLKKYPNVRIVETPRNAGFGAGYNTGISYAQGKYILINNPVKILERDGVARMVDKMESDPSIGMLGPKLIHPDGSWRLSPREWPTPLSVVAKRSWLKHVFPATVERYLQMNRDPDEEREAHWIAGGCLMMPRALFEELGGFDDRFFLFFEDTDLCRRVWEAGKRVLYYPSVSGSDKARRLSGSGFWNIISSKVGRIHVSSGFKYFLKWGM